jgi:hypothetical protein
VFVFNRAKLFQNNICLCGASCLPVGFVVKFHGKDENSKNNII